MPLPEQAAHQQAEEVRLSLYRWRDADGTLHTTEQPSPDRPYQRIEREQTPTITIQGTGDSDPTE